MKKGKKTFIDREIPEIPISKKLQLVNLDDLLLLFMIFFFVSYNNVTDDFSLSKNWNEFCFHPINGGWSC